MKKLFFVFIFTMGFLGINGTAFAQVQMKTGSVATTKAKPQVKLPAKVEQTFKSKYGKIEQISKVETLKKEEQTIYRVYYRTSQGSQDLSWADFDEFGKVIQEGKGKAVRKEPAVKTRATE